MKEVLKPGEIWVSGRDHLAAHLPVTDPKKSLPFRSFAANSLGNGVLKEGYVVNAKGEREVQLEVYVGPEHIDSFREKIESLGLRIITKDGLSDNQPNRVHPYLFKFH